ncbi:timeless protein-domain-containing protein [Cryomyces antarcticus]
MGIEEKSQTVDPEVRAYVYSLVSAVGGSSTFEDGRYVLGDDALACLKDLKRWLRLYDEKSNRLDVARCLAEANLVQGDLLEILAQWPDNATEDKLKSKIALACLELLVPLTWPLEIEDMRMTVNHHRHLPFLQLAQVSYKRAILHHDTAKILQATVRICLPSMAQSRSERSARDEGIIKLVLYFIRNVAIIAQPQHLPSRGDESEITRSATVEAFQKQNTFRLLLMISCNIGDDFATQDVVVLEILFHLLKGVDVGRLFMEREQLVSSNTEELRGLIQKEKAMLSGYARHGPTRHNRFGTLVWVKREGERVSTVSGQIALVGDQDTLWAMDKSKKWNKPKNRGRKTDDPSEHNEFDNSTSLTASARKQLRRFVEEFLDSSFNPLFAHLRKAIERETDRVLPVHTRQYFYLIAWFLRAERARRTAAKQKSATKPPTAVPDPEDESFAFVASVLNQETFILLNRHMQRSQDEKQWQDLNAGMKCFTQILLTVQEMSESPSEDDQEIAENIQNRIFYEEATHDRIIALLRSYKDQGFGYLDACTELSHVFLRMLERYSKQNLDLQVRSRRRARTKKKAKQATQGVSAEDHDQGPDAEDVAEAQRVTRERKFDFARFSARFMTQGCVDTFVAFTRFYADLSTEQLKRAHRFFYRTAFKMELAVILFRVDILQLFNKMIKGPEGLDPELPAFKEWEELVRQVFRRVVKKMQERPELAVELLFSKINATTFYLEHGYEREVPKKTPRPPAELEVKPGMERADQIGVAVSVIINQNKSDVLKWIKDLLSAAATERQSWQDAEAARKSLLKDSEEAGDEVVEVPPEKEDENQPRAPSILVRADTDDRRTALFRDKHLRLLLALLNFQRLGSGEDPDASWIIPSSISADSLNNDLEAIRRFEFAPPSYEDGKSAEDFLRSKAAARRTRAAFDDSDGQSNASDGDNDFLFAAGGPTARKSTALGELKSRRTRRSRKEPLELDDEEIERRAEARRKAEFEKRKKIKSDVLVRDSDDEDDEERDREFFAKEEERRKAAADGIKRALMTDRGGARKRKSAAKRDRSGKRRKTDNSDEEEDNEEDDVLRVRSPSTIESDRRIQIDSDGEEEATDTPLSSQPLLGAEKTGHDESFTGMPIEISATRAGAKDTIMAVGDDEDEDDIVVSKPVRRNVRAGFIDDSDSE